MYSFSLNGIERIYVQNGLSGSFSFTANEYGPIFNLVYSTCLIYQNKNIHWVLTSIGNFSIRFMWFSLFMVFCWSNSSFIIIKLKLKKTRLASFFSFPSLCHGWSIDESRGTSICPASLAWIFNEHLNHLKRSVKHYVHHDTHLENVSLVPVCWKFCLLTFCWNDRKNKWEKGEKILEQKRKHYQETFYFYFRGANRFIFLFHFSVCIFPFHYME